MYRDDCLQAECVQKACLQGWLRADARLGPRTDCGCREAGPAAHCEPPAQPGSAADSSSAGGGAERQSAARPSPVGAGARTAYLHASVHAATDEGRPVFARGNSAGSRCGGSRRRPIRDRERERRPVSAARRLGAGRTAARRAAAAGMAGTRPPLCERVHCGPRHAGRMTERSSPLAVH